VNAEVKRIMTTTMKKLKDGQDDKNLGIFKDLHAIER
jgi:hypothetical protein